MRTSVFPSVITICGIFLAALCWPAAPTWGAGSVISSFRLSGYGDPYANGIYVGGSYASVIYCTAGPDYLYRYRFNGALLGSYPLNGTSTPRGGDAAHLGGAYISLVDSDASRVFIYRVTGGAPVTSFAASGPGSGTLQDVMWTGSYYEVTDHLGNGRFNRYTSTGSFAGTVAYDGWPTAISSTGAVAFTGVAEGRRGSYLVASPRSNGQPSCIIDIGGRGSLITTFTMPPYYASGGCCGRSSKVNKFGTAYWTTWIVSNAIWCYEVDIGGLPATAMVPASLGQVKAVYR